MSQLNHNTQAILLLTTHFEKKGPVEYKPLTPTEWGRFARWMRDQSIVPGDLLESNRQDLLRGYQDETISMERIENLINRGATLALSIEKWSRAGLWVITRSDSAYPLKLKDRLGHNSPPVLFGSGDKNLLNVMAIAAVGSRNITDDDINFSRSIGAKAAASGFALVSGGARGVDESSMLGALEADGTAIGILADSLLKKTTSRTFRNHIQRNNLVLISPFSPEAGFNVGNAMARNKYIYCLSDTAVVVHSGRTGGTWNGATENLKQKWVPLWIKKTNDLDSGNSNLVNLGGHWLPEDILNLDLGFLFDDSEEGIPQSPQDDVQIESISENSLYEVFLMRLGGLLEEDPLTRKELQGIFDLTPSQLDAWLTKAVVDGKISKKGRPMRYEITHGSQNDQLAMFDSE